MNLANLLVAAGLTVGAASAASAKCWEECVLPNPFSGGCGKYVKVCDVSDPGRAAASLGNDIKDAENRIIANWHEVYGDLPPVLRNALDRYPVTFAVVLFPETQGYAWAVAALETLVANTRSRSQAAAPIVQSPATPDWKKIDVEKGEEFLLSLDTQEISTTDWNSPAAIQLRDRFAEPWAHFLTCVDHAQAVVEGNQCLHQLKRETSVIE